MKNYIPDFIVDDNKKRQARLSPSGKIPVVGNDALLTHQPEIVFISSWRFAKMIISNNVEYLSRGGKFLIPLPEIKIIESIQDIKTL